MDLREYLEPPADIRIGHGRLSFSGSRAVRLRRRKGEEGISVWPEADAIQPNDATQLDSIFMDGVRNPNLQIARVPKVAFDPGHRELPHPAPDNEIWRPPLFVPEPPNPLMRNGLSTVVFKLSP